MSDAEFLWRDLILRLSEVYEVVDADNEHIRIRDRDTRAEETLLFTPDEWFSLLTRPSEGDGDVGAPPYTPSWAYDELWETLGSKGSPVRIRDRRLYVERQPCQ